MRARPAARYAAPTELIAIWTRLAIKISAPTERKAVRRRFGIWFPVNSWICRKRFGHAGPTARQTFGVGRSRYGKHIYLTRHYRKIRSLAPPTRLGKFVALNAPDTTSTSTCALRPEDLESPYRRKVRRLPQQRPRLILASLSLTITERWLLSILVFFVNVGCC
jgi:hypothetical protein